MYANLYVYTHAVHNNNRKRQLGNKHQFRINTHRAYLIEKFTICVLVTCILKRILYCMRLEAALIIAAATEIVYIPTFESLLTICLHNICAMF